MTPRTPGDAPVVRERLTMRAQDTADQAGREQTNAAEKKGAVKNLTKQRQPKDAGPLSKERDVGQFGGERIPTRFRP